MKAHFIGLSGVGMSATARLLRQQGWEISGSDEGFYPPVSDYLKEHNLPCHPRYDAANIPPKADLIIIGKHTKLVPEENEEVRAALASGIPVKSFPEVLHELTEATINYVAVGSYGKSTCAALAAFTLEAAGKKPSYFVGAIPHDLPSNAELQEGEIFVLEGDEYPAANWDKTAKFLAYNPRHVLLISCEHDHFNVFPTLESYLGPYLQLLEQVPNEGTIVACLDGENVPRVLAQAGRPAVTYSLAHGEADWRAAAISRGEESQFDLVFRGRTIARLSSPLIGDHNIENLVGVAAWLLTTQAVTVEELKAALARFRGVKRRLELKTTPAAEIAVWENFGSSRAKAEAGIITLHRQFPHQRLIAVFEPHTFSFRNRASLPWYDTLFAQADIVFIYQPPLHGAATHDQLSQAEIVAAIKQTGKIVYPMASKEDLLARLKSLLTPGDIILMITSGSLDGAIEMVASYVNRHFAGERRHSPASLKEN